MEWKALRLTPVVTFRLTSSEVLSALAERVAGSLFICINEF